MTFTFIQHLLENEPSSAATGQITRTINYILEIFGEPQLGEVEEDTYILQHIASAKEDDTDITNWIGSVMSNRRYPQNQDSTEEEEKEITPEQGERMMRKQKRDWEYRDMERHRGRKGPESFGYKKGVQDARTARKLEKSRR